MSEQQSIPPAGDITDNDKLRAALSYPIPIIAIVILLVEDMKNRPFQKFHAIQALAANVIVWLAITILGCILGFLTAIIGGICGSAALVLWLVLPYWAYQAYQGLYFEIPYLTKFMQDQNWL